MQPSIQRLADAPEYVQVYTFPSAVQSEDGDEEEQHWGG